MTERENIAVDGPEPAFHLWCEPDFSLVAWFRFWWQSRELYRKLQDDRWTQITGDPPPPDQDWWEHLEHG